MGNQCGEFTSVEQTRKSRCQRTGAIHAEISTSFFVFCRGGYGKTRINANIRRFWITLNFVDESGDELCRG